MKRIDFLKRIFLGAASLLVAKNVDAKPQKTNVDVYLNSPYIAGFQYYKGPMIEKYLTVGDSLCLKRESDNHHDFFAVEVYYKNQKLGYLPRTDNKIVARMIDQGVPLKAKIGHIYPHAEPFRKVKLRVYSAFT